MPSNPKDNKIQQSNKELEEQLEALKEEVDLLRKSFLPGENYYKDRFYKISENVNDVVYRYNIIERKYEYISPQVQKLFGYAQQDFYANPSLVKTIIHPENVDEYIYQWKRILAGNVPEFFEIKIKKAQGDVRWVLQKNLAIKDNQGNIVAIEGIVTDITDKKAAEEALIESEAQKKAILNNLPHLAWLKDCEGEYMSVNNTFSCHLNKTYEEIVGKTDFDIYNHENARRYRDEDLHVIVNKKKLYIEENSQNKIWETFKAPIFNNYGEVIGVTGIALEISARKKTEEEIKKYSEKLAVQNVKLKLVNDELKSAKEKAEEADRLKSAFLANMSHEIRTPMNAILGFATLLKERKLPEPKQIEFINLINTNCRQLLHIISDIIDISKIEANQITVYNKEFSINKALEVLARNFDNQIKAIGKNIDLVVDCALPDSKAQIYTDKVRLEQILSNLLSNAIKFTEKGQIELGYYLSETKMDLVFYVKDTGIGLTHGEQKVIFERFRQVSSSYNKQYGGTGLGLSISKGLTTKLGGNIWVKSEINSGSTFYISIPFKAGNKVTQEKIPYKEVYHWENKTILVVEDELANYTLLANIIMPTMAKIIWAKDGNEAVQECKNNPKLDLVLMDIKMPNMNGVDATRHIKKINKSLPVIAQTAFAMPNDEKNCREAGCDDYFAKPLMVDDILAKLHQYLGDKKLKAGKNKKVVSDK